MNTENIHSDCRKEGEQSPRANGGTDSQRVPNWIGGTIFLSVLVCLFGLPNIVPHGNAEAALGGGPSDLPRETLTYRHFEVVEQDGRVVRTVPLSADPLPPWAEDVSQQPFDWSAQDGGAEPLFKGPIPFVLPPPEGSDEPFKPHNHYPDITWLPNGDLLAIWCTTVEEKNTVLTILASRLRIGKEQWDPASEFFKAKERNMTGSSLFYDKTTGVLHHMNGMGPEGVEGWGRLALLHRYSLDNGVTWSAARPVSSGANYQRRHQVIAAMERTAEGTLIQPCDATPRHVGNTAIHLSRDGGRTWSDPGGEIRGIHAGVVELKDGRLLAFGRERPIDGRMPMSISDDMGETWNSAASEFPRIRDSQRLQLLRLREGPLLLVSFTNRTGKVLEPSMTFVDEEGNEFEGVGMYAALSYDEGETWPVRKLLTPGEGEYQGYGWTGKFQTTPTRAEHAGYLAITQSPDRVIHLVSSGLHYRFNLKWLETPARPLK